MALANIALDNRPIGERAFLAELATHQFILFLGLAILALVFPSSGTSFAAWLLDKVKLGPSWPAFTYAGGRGFELS
jgi:hypothetical protein